MKKRVTVGLIIMTLCCLFGCGNAETTDSSKVEKIQFDNSIEKDEDAEDEKELGETMKDFDEKSQMDDLQSE